MIFGRPERPAVCSSLRPTVEMCGSDAGEAMRILIALEIATAPEAGDRSPVRHVHPG
jgi:hypothetical protein